MVCCLLAHQRNPNVPAMMQCFRHVSAAILKACMQDLPHSTITRLPPGMNDQGCLSTRVLQIQVHVQKRIGHISVMAQVPCRIEKARRRPCRAYPALAHYSWEARLAGADWAFNKRANGGSSAAMCPDGSSSSGLLPHLPDTSALSSQATCRALLSAPCTKRISACLFMVQNQQWATAALRRCTKTHVV